MLNLPLPHLSRSEWQLLQTLRSGCTTREEITARFGPSGLPQSTVLALLHRLTANGIIELGDRGWTVQTDLYEALLREHVARFVDDYELSAPEGLEILCTILRQRGSQAP